jgi:hypothetical protein
MKSELNTFDGLDNRREVMILLNRLGSDQARANFLTELVGQSRNGFSGTRPQVVSHCDAVTAYFMMVSICNELGVSINYAAKRLDKVIQKELYKRSTYGTRSNMGIGQQDMRDKTRR